jgi:hypothetical protein
MVESLIIDRLLGNEAIKNYTNGNLFISSAPEGTVCPYIVITTEDELDDSGAIAIFGITINIYDFSEDKKPQRDISEIIRKLLHQNLLDGDGYSSVRLFFRSRVLIRETESTLSRILMQFDGRGCDGNNINNFSKEN